MKKIVTVVVCCLAFLAMSAPASAGSNRFIEIVKNVTGPDPGEDFTIRVDCGGEMVTDYELAAGETADWSATSSLGVLNCTVTEIDDQGATSVSYSCTEVEGSATCEGDNTVSWDADLQGTARVVITNDFNEPTTTQAETTTTTTSTTTSVEARVAAQPRFTG